MTQIQIDCPSMSQHVNLLTEDIVKQYGNTFWGKVKHSCRTARSTNMHLTNQFRPAFRLPSLQFAGENEQHVVAMEISWGGWQTLCVPRFMPRCSPKLRLQIPHILRNGNGALNQDTWPVLTGRCEPESKPSG